MDRDSRGEGNAGRPFSYQDDAGNSKYKDRNSKRRRYSSSSDTDAEIRLFTKRTRRNSNLAITAILESVHLSNTGLRLYANECDEKTIRKAQSYLQTEGFLTDIGLANITRLFRDVKLAREYLQLWEGHPFSVVSMKEWFLVVLRYWKKRGGSISGQAGRGDDFGDNFFLTPRLVLVEAPPLITASGGNVVPAEARRMGTILTGSLDTRRPERRIVSALEESALTARDMDTRRRHARIMSRLRATQRKNCFQGRRAFEGEVKATPDRHLS